MKKEKNDITLKISAILIALTMWTLVMTKENPLDSWPERNIDVMFNNTENLSKNGLVIMSPENASVNVEVSGRKLDRINSFSPDDIKAEVDLSGYTEGQRKVPIKVTISDSSKMTITDWQPREILFDFDKIITKEKPVTIITEGELAEGYVLGDITTKSDYILLKGPRSWVDEVTNIVASINISDKKGDLSVTRPIKLLDVSNNTVEKIESQPDIIDIFIPVYKTNNVEIEIMTIGVLPENYEIGDMEINPKTITVKGKESISNLKLVQTKPIDINSFIDNESVKVELELPRNVSLLNPDEEITASLKIDEIFTKTLEYQLDEINLRNLASKLDFEIKLEGSSEKIEISLKGDKESIESLTKEDIEIYLDLNLLNEGEHEVYLLYNIPEDLIVTEITPQIFKINLTSVD